MAWPLVYLFLLCRVEIVCDSKPAIGLLIKSLFNWVNADKMLGVKNEIYSQLIYIICCVISLSVKVIGVVYKVALCREQHILVNWGDCKDS